jgi:hypothetical protein
LNWVARVRLEYLPPTTDVFFVIGQIFAIEVCRGYTSIVSGKIKCLLFLQ